MTICSQQFGNWYIGNNNTTYWHQVRHLYHQEQKQRICTMQLTYILRPIKFFFHWVKASSGNTYPNCCNFICQQVNFQYMYQYVSISCDIMLECWYYVTSASFIRNITWFCQLQTCQSRRYCQTLIYASIWQRIMWQHVKLLMVGLSQRGSMSRYQTRYWKEIRIVQKYLTWTLSGSFFFARAEFSTNYSPRFCRCRFP